MELSVNVPNHTYQILIENDGLKQVGQWVTNLWKPQKILIITDDNVAPLYEKRIVSELKKRGFTVTTEIIPAGEKSKSLNMAEMLYTSLAEQSFTRSDGIIALGGGVVGDLAGFVAATYMRGIHFLQIPTTLLAQVDSSIGGKTAVNLAEAKNIIGCFAQPDGVLIDPTVLQTLDNRRLQEGLAEIVKYAAIRSPELWNMLCQLQDERDFFSKSEEIIAACCEIKREVVAHDEKDQGVRQILNFGHTIGHAIEQNAGYGVITHGEAVAMGMVQITKVAEKNGLTPKGISQQLTQLLGKFHLSTEFPDFDQEKMYEAIRHDKKAHGQTITIVLLTNIGECQLTTIPMTEIKTYLAVK